MTRAAHTARHRKGRMLLVGMNNGLADIADRLDPPAARAANLFDAIGEITTAPAHAPIAAVVVSDRALTERGDSALTALRRTDPAIAVYVLLGPDVRPSSASELERPCDGVLYEPVDAMQLQRLLDQECVAPHPVAPSVEPAAETPADPPPMRIAERPLREPAPTIDETAAAAPAPRPMPDVVPVEIELGSVPPRPLAAGAAHEPLGDTDLIEAAMSGPRGVVDAALQVLRQHTGWTEAQLLDQPGAADADAPVCEVVIRQQRFGWLAPGCAAGRTDVERWAGWLARWLLLDHHYRTYRRMAYQDELTGAWNRRYFFRFLNDTIRRAAAVRRPVTLMVFDIDDFKKYNDLYGHEAGDVILIETVRLLKSEIRPCDRVCRIGGDEFAVVFADLGSPREVGSTHPATVELIARRFQKQICEMKFPKLGIDAPGTLSISGGLASYPWDGADPTSLLHHADQLSLQSKRKGKNALTFGPGAQEACPPCDKASPADDEHA